MVHSSGYPTRLYQSAFDDITEGPTLLWSVNTDMMN